MEQTNVIQPKEPLKVEAAIADTLSNTAKTGAKSSSEASSSVYKGDCLTCNFECSSENELDIHMENEHQVPRPVPRAVHPDGRACLDCKTKDTVISTQINKVERLELKITDIETDLKSVNLEKNILLKEKEKRENDYQEACRAIGDQQRKASESAEKIKVLEGLLEVEEAKRVTQQQSDEWEEVWEDDNSGNLIPQKRKELDKYQWKPDLACKKCDKVLQSDQHMRQHIKEHTRLQNQLIICHHCDFVTNDEVIHTNHMVDVHSTKHTCQSCSAVFPTKSDMVKHAGDDHGLVYNKNEGALKSIDCHDCDECFQSKFELMQHKEKNHYKKRLCSYYHGNGWGCRFLNKCLDIHNENITPVITSDHRANIECRHGDSCFFYNKGKCHYKHTHVMPAPSAPPLEDEDIEFLPRNKCDQCGYETNTETEFKWHRETQHGARIKEFRGITVTNKTTYPVGHPQWAIDRNKSTEYKCNECTSVFNIESMFNAHMTREHNTNFSHTCTKCNQIFHTKEEVEEHIKSHATGFSIEAAVMKMSEQMNTISQRVESLEQSSLTHFPNLGPQLRKK